MTAPWARRSPTEWLWVQLRCGARARRVYRVPHVDLPGAAAGAVSTRRWLNWRQANSATAFGIAAVRSVAAALAADGIEPSQRWLEQSWRTYSGRPNRRAGFMDPHGERNVAGLINTIHYPADSDLYGLRDLDVSDLTRYGWKVRSGGYLAGSAADTRTIIVESPHYYCGFGGADACLPTHFSSRHWPLDALNEREPMIFDRDPWAVPAAGEVPDAADEVLARVAAWGALLGFTVGAPAARWRPAPIGRRRYVVTAPVEVTADPQTMYARALPYEGAMQVTRGSRAPSAPHIHGRSDLVRFGDWRRFDARIADPWADDRFVLTVESPPYRNRHG